MRVFGEVSLETKQRLYAVPATLARVDPNKLDAVRVRVVTSGSVYTGDTRHAVDVEVDLVGNLCPRTLAEAIITAINYGHHAHVTVKVSRPFGDGQVNTVIMDSSDLSEPVYPQ